ncbi:MAG TPA: GNAT family N-acetyltransferase [Armatimonadota bacterium]|jgi:ribosomal-protein-alanine N-acetyltransferase
MGWQSLPDVLATERLLLRPWREEDRPALRRLNADPRVMELMPAKLSPEESDRFMDRMQAGLQERGYGLLAAELRDTGECLGLVGLAAPQFQAHFTPCVEVGWRLLPEFWGRGFATEGARACLQHAFGEVGLQEVVSFTVPHNLRSRRVMEKLGMSHQPEDDFDHPNLPEGHPLRRHVLYRLRRPEG